VIDRCELDTDGRRTARNGQSSFSPIADGQDLYPTFLVAATRARFMLGRNVEDPHTSGSTDPRFAIQNLLLAYRPFSG